jgi:hypothetical protein
MIEMLMVAHSFREDVVVVLWSTTGVTIRGVEGFSLFDWSNALRGLVIGVSRSNAVRWLVIGASADVEIDLWHRIGYT